MDWGWWSEREREFAHQSTSFATCGKIRSWPLCPCQTCIILEGYCKHPVKIRLAPSQTNCAVGHIILAKFLHVSCMAKHSISSFIILLPFHFFRCLLLHFALKLLIHPPAAFCSQAHLTKVRALFNQLGTDERSVITFRQHLGEQDSVSCSLIWIKKI